MDRDWNDNEKWIHCDTLLTPFRRQEDCVVHVSAGKITEILPSPEKGRIPRSLLLYEPGASVVPGFIDVHVHGAGGGDTMDARRESLQCISETLARHGTTSFLATTISAPPPETANALRSAAEHGGTLTGARLLGVHMEGPYINPLRRGAHRKEYLKAADVVEFQNHVDLSGQTIRKITLAPEMDYGLELTRQAVRLGICVSMGHSDATFEQAEAAAEIGARCATHTFNAMRPFHQREPGILGAVLTDDTVYAEVIADGIHVHTAGLRMLLRAKGIDRIVLVSDAISATGMPDGRYKLGDMDVVVEGGKCRNEDGILAGSTLTLDQAIRHLVAELDLPLDEVLPAATASPARSLGIAGNKGIVSPGADADLTFLDDNLEVIRTMVGGRVAYSRSRT